MQHSSVGNACCLSIACAVTSGSRDLFSKNLLAAFSSGLVTTTQLQAAVRRIMSHRFMLGLFDDPRDTIYFGGKYNSSSTIHSREHADLARQAAQQSVVVVQNPHSLLPLNAEKVKSIALIGPMMNITDVFLGDYRPAACPGPAAPAPAGTSCLPTLVELIGKRAPKATLHVAPGCGQGSAAVPCTSQPPVTAAVKAAMAAADVIVLGVGEKTTDNDHEGNTGGEGKDRDSIGLPGRQAELVDAAIESKKPVVLLILSGGAVSIDNVTSAHAKETVAVCYAGFGGEAGQNALVDILVIFTHLCAIYIFLYRV
jgi:beta-glucosidase